MSFVSVAAGHKTFQMKTNPVGVLYNQILKKSTYLYRVPYLNFPCNLGIEKFLIALYTALCPTGGSAAGGEKTGLQLLGAA